MLDVWNPEEYRNERIEGPRNVPVDSLRFSLERMDRDTSLLVYCKVGKRCVRVVYQLNEMGFHDVRVLDGGIETWKAHHLKIEKSWATVAN